MSQQTPEEIADKIEATINMHAGSGRRITLRERITPIVAQAISAEREKLAAVERERDENYVRCEQLEARLVEVLDERDIQLKEIFEAREGMEKILDAAGFPEFGESNGVTIPWYSIKKRIVQLIEKLDEVKKDRDRIGQCVIDQGIRQGKSIDKLKHERDLAEKRLRECLRELLRWRFHHTAFLDEPWVIAILKEGTK